MEKDTMRFIRSIKRNSNGDKPIREVAIDWYCEYSGCPRETYNEANLYDVVLYRFLDYLDTADRPSAVIRQLLDSRRIRNYITDKKGRPSTVIEDMLTTLMLARVLDDNDNYINGFTKDIDG